MADGEERPFMRAQLSLMVLRRAVVLLLLTHSCAGQPQVTEPSQPIVAMIGDDIILPCHLESANPLDVTVEWTRRDLKPIFVHLRRDRADLLDEQHSSYTGRTSLSTDRLKCGDLSLKLSSVRLSDAGTYRCLVPRSTTESTTESVVQLVVGSVSSPNIAFSKASNGVLLDCKSKGWFPEPEASWLDSKGNLLSTGPSETVTGPDQLYTVSSRVTVEKRHSNSFTCRVQQKIINQTRDTQIHVPDDFFMTPSTTALRITISLAACFLCILTVALVAWKIKKTDVRQGKNQRELQLLMVKQEPRTSSEKMKSLDTAEEKRDEEFNRNDEELTNVVEVISKLKEQKNNLRKQKETINSLLEVMRKWTEGEVKKIKNEKIKITKDQKLKREKKIKELQTRETDQKKLLTDTQDQLLTDTDEIILKLIERKGKLESEKELIEKQKKEKEKQRKELQRKLQSETKEKTDDPQPETKELV